MLQQRSFTFGVLEHMLQKIDWKIKDTDDANAAIAEWKYVVGRDWQERRRPSLPQIGERASSTQWRICSLF